MTDTEWGKIRKQSAQAPVAEEIDGEVQRAVARALDHAYPGENLRQENLQREDKVLSQEGVFRAHYDYSAWKSTRRDKLVSVNTTRATEWRDSENHLVIARTGKGPIEVYDRDGNLSASIDLAYQAITSGDYPQATEMPHVAKITYYAPDQTIEHDGHTSRQTLKIRDRQDKATQAFKKAQRNGPPVGADEDDGLEQLAEFGETIPAALAAEQKPWLASHLAESPQGHRHTDHTQTVAIPSHKIREEEYRLPNAHLKANDLDARLAKTIDYHASGARTKTIMLGRKGTQVEHYDKDGKGTRITYDHDGNKLEEVSIKQDRKKKLSHEERAEKQAKRTIKREGKYGREGRSDDFETLQNRMHQVDIDDARAHLPETIKAEEKRQREIERQIEARKESQTNVMWDKRQIELNTYPQEPDDGSQTPDVQVQREKRDRSDHRFVPEETREDRRSQIEAKLHQQETQAEADGDAKEVRSGLRYQPPSNLNRRAYEAKQARWEAAKAEQREIAEQTDQMWADRKAELEHEAKTAQQPYSNGITSSPRDGRTQRTEIEEPAAKGFDGRHQLRTAIHQREIDDHHHNGQAHEENGFAHTNGQHDGASSEDVLAYQRLQRRQEELAAREATPFTDRIINSLELAQSRNGNGKKGREDR